MPTSFTDEEVKELGLTENLIRLSVGLEDVSYLIHDVNQALNGLWSEVIFVKNFVDDGKKDVNKSKFACKTLKQTLGFIERLNTAGMPACMRWFVCNSLTAAIYYYYSWLSLSALRLLIHVSAVLSVCEHKRELDKDFFGSKKGKNRKKNVFACVLMPTKNKEQAHTKRMSKSYKWGISFVSEDYHASMFTTTLIETAFHTHFTRDVR